MTKSTTPRSSYVEGSGWITRALWDITPDLESFRIAPWALFLFQLNGIPALVFLKPNMIKQFLKGIRNSHIGPIITGSLKSHI